MNYIWPLLLLVSCAHHPPKSIADDLVTVDAALNQAQSSYLKGCVLALKELKIPGAFSGCRDKAVLHRQELESFMNQTPLD